jgi:hypothetical protein
LIRQKELVVTEFITCIIDGLILLVLIVWIVMDRYNIYLNKPASKFIEFYDIDRQLRRVRMDSIIEINTHSDPTAGGWVVTDQLDNACISVDHADFELLKQQIARGAL